MATERRQTALAQSHNDALLLVRHNLGTEILSRFSGVATDLTPLIGLNLKLEAKIWQSITIQLHGESSTAEKGLIF